MRVTVKPLTHWVIYKRYTVRFNARTPQAVTGVLTTPEGEINFSYNPQTKVIQLPDATVTINDYGWETTQEATS